MKKSLLLASLAIAAAPAFALTDGFTYETVNGITCNNIWFADHNLNDASAANAAWMALPFAEQYAKARTACLGQYNGQDVILVGFSQTLTDGESSNDYAHIVILDFATGAVIKTVQMTADGNPITGLLCANQIGCDQFGHVWFAGYVATNYSASTNVFTPVKVYVVDDLDAGTCHLAAELNIPADETDAAGRYDYYDLVGDITLQEAGCTFMTAIASGTAPYVVAWTCEQGGTEWEGGMDGYYSAALDETYPAGVADWGTAPMVRIVLDEDYSNNLFYVDGFTTCPSLYSNSGTMVDGFMSAVDLAPALGTNGVGEFSLAGKDFIAYSFDQYVGETPCQVYVCELGEGQSFDGMEKYWEIPQKGMGAASGTSDGGLRIHVVETKIYTDANGKEGAYLLTYKCNNGVGVYAIAEEGWEDPNAGVSEIVSDNNNAPVEYFNLNGVRVDGNNLPAGLYITRQGTTVAKQIVK